MTLCVVSIIKQRASPPILYVGKWDPETFPSSHVQQPRDLLGKVESHPVLMPF